MSGEASFRVENYIKKYNFLIINITDERKDDEKGYVTRFSSRATLYTGIEITEEDLKKAEEEKRKKEEYGLSGWTICLIILLILIIGVGGWFVWKKFKLRRGDNIIEVNNQNPLMREIN